MYHLYILGTRTNTLTVPKIDQTKTKKKKMLYTDTDLRDFPIE